MKIFINSLFLLTLFAVYGQKQPNVIVLLTDDQGIGDLACHGNPIIKTPNLDKFHEESLRLTNFHVDPTCSPTRAALMTGHYSNRAGVWHTVQGRSILRRRETTIADVFKDNGYKTAMYGKWHLGDAYPYRPEDRGFEHAVIHGSGAIGQAADYWGNDLFNDTYFVNSKLTKFNGYCTDIWFSEAEKFILEAKNEKKPFFVYLATNAPHQPLRVPQKYIDMYIDQPELQEDKSVIPFYGMITNIDDNFGKLQDFLKANNLDKNTIVIYTTDNGSAGGSKIYNANYKGGKGTVYEGGHRVPFMIQWPDGNFKQGKDLNEITAHVDILPTFIDLLNLKTDNPVTYDGTSLKKYLLNDDNSNLENRSLIVESQRVKDPIKWRNNVVMYKQWRLVNGEQLYYLNTDIGEGTDVSPKYPKIVEKLRAEYEFFWDDVSKEHDVSSHLVIGAPEQNPTILVCMDHVTDKKFPPFNMGSVTNNPAYDAPWNVEVEHDGNYEISIRRWPAELNMGINEHPNKQKIINSSTAYFELGDLKINTAFDKKAKEVTFKTFLKKGQYQLRTGFITATNERFSARYAYALNSDFYKKDIGNWQTTEGLGIPLVDKVDLKIIDYPEILNTFKKKKR